MIFGISGKLQSGKNTTAFIIQYLIDKKKAGYKTKNTEEDFNSYVKNKHYLKCNYQQKAFADKLKDIVCLLINCTREQLENEDFKNEELGKEWWYYLRNKNRTSKMYPYLEGKPDFESNLIKLTPRLLLQLIGTDCGRNIIHTNIWINSLFANYNTKKYSVGIDKYGHQTIVDKYPNWIITDMRFPNELRAVKDRDGISIRINRPDEIIATHQAFLENTKGKYLPYKLIGAEEHPSETALDNAEFDYIIDNNGSIEELIEKVRVILLKQKII